MAHDGVGDHYHDLGERVASTDDTVVWTTVGLDIGSSTTQAVFSRITLAREDAYYVVRERAILHQSRVILTPYASPEVIDRVRLADFLEREFEAAHLSRARIDAGAVIMTGLALSSLNARAIADAVADDSGRFVAVSAGDLLEARLAAHGAGLPELSTSNQGLILHIDIGGGTSKLSAWRAGKLLHLAAIDVGARLVTVDGNGRIASIEAPVGRIARQLALDLRVGEPLRPDVAATIAGVLARDTLRYAGIMNGPLEGHSLLRTSPLFAAGEQPEIQGVVFSGGVSEYIYEREARRFGDLGMPLGRAVRAAVEASGVRMLASDRGIRATVLGASQHSVQLSGNTIFVSDSVPLPLRNIPVLLPAIDLAAAVLQGPALVSACAAAIEVYAQSGAGQGGLALAIRWQGSPTFQRISVVAESLAAALDAYLGEGVPCVVLIDGDVAGLIGARMEQVLAGRRAVVCLDGVHVHEFDHLDIGSFGSQARALPVVVKSLLFAENLKTRSHHHVHH